MQRIERYGVIALALLLVTIAAVSLWDEGGQANVANTEAATNKQQMARLDAERSKPVTKAAQRNLPKTAERKGPKKPVWGKTGSTKRSGLASGPGTNSPLASRNQGFDVLKATTTTTPEVDRTPAVPENDRVEFPVSASGRDSRTNPDKLIRPKEQASTPVANNYLPQNKETQPAMTDVEKSRGKSLLLASPTGTASTYTVVNGDTLSGISSKTLGTSKRWREIQALNGNIEPSKIREGMTLILPGGATVASHVPAQVSPKSTNRAKSLAGQGTYVVRRGDVLSQIAQDELGSASLWRRIADLNPQINPNVLHEGTELRMPASAAVASNVTPTPRTRKKNHVR